MTSVSCSSSVSAQKSPRSDNRSKSCDTVCTSNSSCFFKRRKPMNPLAYPLRPALHKTNPSSIKQRVMSAKMLKLRQLQSQLNDANFHLAEVTRENQTLRTLQKRQDKALSKYESSSADLPRLLRCHEEEIKVLTEKNRNLRRTVRDVTEQLKLKEDELNKAREQLVRLEKLNKDKHLTERERLMEKLEGLREDLRKSEEQVVTLNRKLLLETKISKQRLNAEIVKHKQCQKELLHAFDEIDRLSGLLDAKENIARPRNQKFNKLQSKDSLSMVSLRQYQNANRSFSNDRLSTLKDAVQTPVTEVKLEPLINCGARNDSDVRKGSDGFKAPQEIIRQRLSSGSRKILTQDSAENSNDSRENSAGSLNSRPASSVKLEKLPLVLENRRLRGKIKSDEEEGMEDKSSIGDEERVGIRREVTGGDDEDVTARCDDDHNVASVSDRTSRSDQDDKKEHVDITFDERRSESESDEELVSIIEKMKKTRKDDAKSDNRPRSKVKRKNSEGRSDSGDNQSKSENEEIDRITETLDAAVQRVTENSKEEFDKKLGNYYSEVLSSMKNCSKTIRAHKEGLENSKQDTDALIAALARTAKVESKLKKSFFNMDDDMKFVNEILNEEYKFRAQNKAEKKKPLVDVDNKRKLLATLRAIDNGDSVDSFDEQKNDNCIKERFGNVAH